LSDLCSKLGTAKPVEQGSRADSAAWEETSSDLYRRFGSGTKKDVPSSVPHTEGSSTWSTSVLQGKHSRTIQATWDKVKGKLSVIVKGNANGSPLGKGKERVGDYIIRINTDIVEEKDQQGKIVLRTHLPQTGAVEALAVGCDEKERIDLNGTWTDNLGRAWTIKHSPIMCGGPQATITLERINENNYKIVHKGMMANWTIEAEHHIAHPDAVTDPKPFWVRRIIASGEKGKASFVLSLSPRRQPDGTLSLDGTFTGFNVTWNPDEKVVRKVFAGYEKPIVLTQAKAKREFRIVRIEEDIEAWLRQARELQTKINQLKGDITYFSERIKEKKAALEAVHQEHQELLDGYSKRVALVHKSGVELNDSSTSGLGCSRLEEQRDNLVQKKRFLENEVKFLKEELADIEAKLTELLPLKEKHQAEIDELENRKIRKQNLIQSKSKQLAETNKKLTETLKSLAELQRKREEFEKDYQSKQERLKDDYYETMKKLKHQESRIKTALNELAFNQNELNLREAELNKILQEQQGLVLDNSPWVQEILVKDSQGNVAGQWSKWLPLEKIEEIKEEGKALKELRDTLKKEKDKAFANFDQAAWKSVAALEEVRKAILTSSYYQAGIESAFYFLDVGSAFAQRGPFGALTEAGGKLAMALLGGGFPEFKHISDDELKTLEKRIYEEYGMKADERFYESNPDVWFDMAYKRTVKDVWLFQVTQRVDKHISSWANEKLTEIYTKKLSSAVKKAQNEVGIYRYSDFQTLKSLSDKCTRLNDQTESLLKKPRVRGARDFIGKIIKDVAKPVLQEMVRSVEDVTWSNYFWTDIQSRAAFNTYRHINQLYWEAADSYAGWEVALKDVVDKFDPKSGFSEIKSLPLTEGSPYTVELKLPNPEGWRGEQVWVGEQKASPAGGPANHQYTLKAVNLKPNDPKGDVVLKVKYGQ
jgi:Chromosome segregation ATPases